MQSVAIGWQVYALTGSAFDLGLVGLCQFLPVLLLTLAVGHVADRYDRRRIVAACQLIEIVTSLTLAVGTATGWLGVHGIFAVVAVVGATRAFESPTLAALMPGLVRDDQFQQASAWAASANQTASIIGPAFGGLFFALGAPVPFAMGTGLYVLAATSVTLITLHTPGFCQGAGDTPLRAVRHHLHLDPPGGARRHLARPVRGLAGRCHGPAADLRARHPAYRVVGGLACCGLHRPSGRSRCRCYSPAIRCGAGPGG